MITELDIFNFQSWEEGHFQFHPGVNVIVGSSDIGKSTVLRTIRWVCWNRPSGTSVVSWWGGPTSVELVTPEGIVARIKDKEEKYILGIPGRKDTLFKAFGLSVPPEISQFLDISDVNFQRQIDQPFLLSLTPGEVASYLNRIAKLDEIDLGLANVNSWISDITSTIGREAIKDKPATGLIKQIQDTTKELDSYSHLEKYEIEVEALEIRDAQLSRLAGNKTQLKNLISTIDNLDVKIEKESKILPLEDDINDIFVDIYDIREKRRECHDLSLRVQAIEIIDDKIEQSQALIGIEGQVTKLIATLNERKSKSKSLTELTSLSKKIKLVDVQIKTTSDSLTKAEETFNKSFPDICPLCGSKQKGHGKN